MMADDEDTQETPDTETPEHAVPTEEATEIAGSAEDAALEALQESREQPQAESTESEQQFEPIPGNAVPSEDATEIAGSAEDAPLEAAQERAEAETVEEAVAEEIIEEALVEEIAEEAVAEEIAEEIVAEAVAEELVEEAIEEAVAEEILEEAVAEEIAEEVVAEVELEEEIEEEEEATPRVKPAVPGAHLEVDIVPEGVDPLGRSEAYGDPYAIEGEESESEVDSQQEDQEEVLSKPISTAAIDLAAGARYRATGKRKTAVARVTLRPGSGSYLVNGRTLEEHFPRITQQRNGWMWSRGCTAVASPRRRGHCVTVSRARCWRPIRTCAASSSAAAS
jgi:hypothetical protein